MRTGLFQASRPRIVLLAAVAVLLGVILWTSYHQHPSVPMAMGKIAWPRSMHFRSVMQSNSGGHAGMDNTVWNYTYLLDESDSSLLPQLKENLHRAGYQVMSNGDELSAENGSVSLDLQISSNRNVQITAGKMH